MKKIALLFVLVLGSSALRAEEKVQVSIEPTAFSVKPARYQFVKELSVDYGKFVTGIMIDTEEGKVWELSGKKDKLVLIPVERVNQSPTKP